MPRIPMTGNEAAAYAMMQINPDVVAAYPITPSTQVVERFSDYVNNGKCQTEFVPVESEHSAMSACVGASACGARVMTATAAQGLALMHEILYIASSMRLPIVTVIASRALNSPLNIHGDHSDTMGSRDSGWLQFYGESVQEFYDHIFIALRAAELSNLPAFVCEDGFILSHTLEPVDVLDKDEIAKYLGERKPLYDLLDTDHPIMAGHLSLQDTYMEHRRKLAEGMAEAPKFIDQAYREFKESFGREYDWMEVYDPHDAEVAILIIGSAAGTAKETVDFLAEEGKRVALVKLLVARPLPVERLRQTLGKYRIVAIMERTDSFKNHGGPMFSEIAGALYHGDKHPILRAYHYGFGGRDIFPEDFMKVYNDLLDMTAGKKDIPETLNYAGLKEG